MFIPVRGLNLYVRREGSGRSIVLVHGLGTPSVWNRVWGPLSQSHDVISIHLPGFGSSAPAKSAHSVHDHALLVKGVIDQLGLEDAVLMGISYGGQVAATLAAMKSGRVSALVIICGAGVMQRFLFLRWNWLFRIIEALATLFIFRSEKSIRWFNRRLYANPANQPQDIVTEFYRMVEDAERRRNWFQCAANAAKPGDDFNDTLSGINVPTLILWGKKDKVIPVKFAETFQAAIGGSISLIFEECGHALPLECPAEMCGAVNQFLKERTASDLRLGHRRRSGAVDDTISFKNSSSERDCSAPTNPLTVGEL